MFIPITFNTNGAEGTIAAAVVNPDAIQMAIRATGGAWEGKCILYFNGQSEPLSINEDYDGIARQLIEL